LQLDLASLPEAPAGEEEGAASGAFHPNLTSMMLHDAAANR